MMFDGFEYYCGDEAKKRGMTLEEYKKFLNIPEPKWKPNKETQKMLDEWKRKILED